MGFVWPKADLMILQFCGAVVHATLDITCILNCTGDLPISCAADILVLPSWRIILLRSQFCVVAMFSHKMAEVNYL